MVQEKITFHEYLLTKRGKEVHLKNDLCFKYAMQNQEVASVVLDTLGFIVKPQDITIRSEIGTGIHIRCMGEHRFDMEIIDPQSQTTYDFELQNYNENISFKMTIKLLERIISDFDIKKNEVKDINELPVTHLIVLDNYTRNSNHNYEEIAIMKKIEDKCREYYKGRIMIHHLQSNVKNDKIKLGKVRFERYKKFLKCFDKDAKELQAQKDEQIINQQEKIVSLVKLLKSLGKTTLEIKEATGLTTDEIEKDKKIIVNRKSDYYKLYERKKNKIIKKKLKEEKPLKLSGNK